MKQPTEDDVNGIANEDNGERLYVETSVQDDPARENEELRCEEEEGEKQEEEVEVVVEREAGGKGYIYEKDEFFAWSEEREYEEGGYGERSSVEDEEMEEGRDAPPSATISTAEKSEVQEVQEVVEPDHALAEIPVEIFVNREAMIGKLNELLTEQAELKRRNRLLESRIVQHMKKTQEKAIPADARTSKDPEQMEQIYRQTLHTYKLQFDDIMERSTRLTADVQSYEDKVRTARDENALMFDELLDRQREVATGLIYAKTGRKITEKAVNEITRRQVSRRGILARDRHGCIVLQHRFEDVTAQLRKLETLGEGMTTMDYEALHMARMSYEDKLDERNKELEKLRCKIAEVVNGVAHYKEKEACLAEDIKLEERVLAEHRKQIVKVREDVNKLHLILRDLRRHHYEKRLEAGLLVAQPVLREMERTMKLLNGLRNDIGKIKHDIHQYGPANGRKRKSSKTLTTMTRNKSGTVPNQ